MHAAPRSTTSALAIAGLLIAGSLTACGGGGGSGSGGTPASSTGGTTKLNPQTAPAELGSAYATSSSLYGMGSSASSLVGKDVGAAGRFSAVDFALGRLRGLMAASEDASGVSAKAVSNATVACSGGGTAVASVSDLDNSGTFSTGDSMSFTFNACRESGVTMSGRMLVSQTVLTGSTLAPSFSMGATFTFESLTVSAPSQPSATINGGFALQAAYTTTPAAVVSATISGTTFSVGTAAGVDTLGDFSASVTINETTGQYQYAVSGRETDTATGTALTISNPVPFQGTVGTYPSSGSLRVRADDGSAARLTATSATSVTVEVDANGDGAYESTGTRTWSQIVSGA